nr:M1 family metallopeptidase [Chitinophagaceae bacterium]
MKNKILLFSIFLFASQFLAAQYYTGSFRSEKNPHYWKNKKPHAAYWQQDVEYKIKAAVDEKTRRIIAKQSLNYYNNSPDTLTFIYFHLYQNAFTKGSYLDKLHSDSKEPITKYGKYEENGMGTIVENIRIDGEKVNSILDNTVLKIYLNKNILPNTSVNIEMDFTTFFDYSGFRRRMQLFNANGFPHFNGVHWYPRICVYDAKKGWDTDQHLNKELYGNFGSFEVELNFANNYIVEATGVLMNEKEMIPEDLKQKIDLKNYVKSSKEEKEKKLIPYDSTKRKTWFFYSVNTHDFAFTAHPDYLRDEVVWNSIRCIALVKKQNANGWKNGAEYVSKIIKTFSTDFGMYEYPKMVAADANDGMEYPMITLDSGTDPGYRGLLVHEIGHNWFYGMIGNNETYRAALDEGFTQFITAWGLEKIDGENLVESPSKSKYYSKYKKPVNVRDRSVFYRYVSDAMMNEDLPLNTHSNDFHSAIGHGGGYSNVYYKTATMLYNLQYVLGDDQFLKAMNYYVAQWKFCHPYFEDFRRSIIEYTKQDLNWFFDQWLETNKTIDYKVQSIKNTKIEDKQRITLKRNGEMQMPLEIKINAKNGDSFFYYIPNQTYIKPHAGKVLPKWYGWDVLNKTYSFDVKIPSGIKSVEIDPSHRLADINKTNNAKTKGSLFSPLTHELKREKFINQFPEWKKYQATWTPNIWYNAV